MSDEKVVEPEEEKSESTPEYPKEMPLIAIKNAIVFPIPHLPVPLVVGRQRTAKAIEQASDEKGYAFVVAQLDGDMEEPTPGDLYEVGTIARLIRFTKPVGEDEGSELMVEGLCRARVVQYLDDATRVEVEVLEDKTPLDDEADALIYNVKELASQVIQLSPRLPDEMVNILKHIKEPNHLCDLVASQLSLSHEQKQELLETIVLKDRLQSVLKHLSHELAILKISAKLRASMRDSLDQHQKEVYLREQLHAIQKELGEDPDEDDDAELKERIENAGMPDLALKVARRELKRLSRMSPQSAEYTVGRTYIDWLLDTPWATLTPDNLDVAKAAELLDQDHYGLDKVKRRITEYLAVRKLKGDLKGPILCLVGPPGVGKTSLSKSIARALGRKFVQSSLGGVKDEAEIRGHRRTYVGAMPGRIIQGLKRAGSMNPVFILDEIDKLASDVRGDPASALLEVLDPEQNHDFMDHYLDVPVDLSQVLFMATANRLDTISPALVDRMEVIEIPGYILDEKFAIAERHLLPRALEDHGLKPEQVHFDPEVLPHVVERYTREAGVRNLSRELAAILRSVARDIACEEVSLPVTVDLARVRTALGPVRYFPDAGEVLAVPGVAIGLAWTPVGGDILFLEANRMAGKGKLILTGQLGDVMRESAQTAMSYIHAHAEALGIPEQTFTERDVHLHIPSGAIPKDGPSAGITLCSALTSLLTDRCMKSGLAMTGEITLRGVVLPIGGVKEKVLAAHRAGMKEIILPSKNEGDLEEIPAKLRSELTFYLVDRVEQVLNLALGFELECEPARTFAEPVVETPKATSAAKATEPLTEVDSPEPESDATLTQSDELSTEK